MDTATGAAHSSKSNSMQLPNTFTDKAGFPYLVDVKITDKCPFGCSFCYQSSTPAGQSADHYFLTQELARSLMEANVLEVNFGGGEPTLYRGSYDYHDFGSIAASFKERHFKVGVTTKNYQWHKSKEFEKTLKHIDSVAISVNDVGEIDAARELKQAINKIAGYNTTVYYQCVFGLIPYNEFIEFVARLLYKSHQARLTLLGYKSFGFGKSGEEHIYPAEWIDVVKEWHTNHKVSIGVDSVMVSNWKDKLIAYGIKDYYLVGTEGKTTCFIDAVNQKVYPSSFSDHPGLKLKKNVWDKTSPSFLEQFSTF